MDKIHQRVPDALKFDAKEVFFVLVAVNMAFLTSLINGVGVISVLASFLFAYVVAVTLFMRFRGSIKAEDTDEDYEFVSKETIQGFIIAAHKMIFAVQSRIRAIKTGDDLRGVAQLLVFFYLTGMAGTFFSPLTLMWIAANLITFASLVATNEKARNGFDNAINSISGLIGQITGIFTNFIPKYSDLKLD